MPSAIDVTLGQRVARIRAGKGLSQGELARRTGVTQTALSYWEAGKRSMGFDGLERIAAALDVPPTSIYLAGTPASYDAGFADGVAAAQQAVASLTSRAIREGDDTGGSGA